MTDTRLDNAIAIYLSGESVETAARQIRIDGELVRRTLKERGLQRTAAENEALKARKAGKRFRERYAEIWDDVVNAYRAGMSENQVSKQFKIQRPSVRRILERSGVHVRNQSEAEFMKWRHMPEEKRQAWAEKTRQRATGRTVTIEEKIKRALTVERKCLNQSDQERIMLGWLEQLGAKNLIPQKAIAAYNADIGAFPVAVEIFGGNFHASGRHAARFVERCHHFADLGWALIVVWCDRTSSPLTIDAAKHVVAFMDEVNRCPSLIGQYRMIGGSGELFAAGSLKSNDLSAVLTRCAALNSRGTDHSVAN